MAGAGYKLFNTGDVLTAAQVNTYLQEQTVMVFADSAARTTALSGVLAEGMMSYLQDTNAVEVYNGSNWVGVSGAGDVTEVQAGTGISVASGTGPIPVVTNTMATEIDAKGDLIVGTGADTFDRLAVGTDGYTLVADSSTATGLAYAAPAGGGGLVHLNTTAFSAVSSQSINDVFSATYDYYKIIITAYGSTAAGINMRLRVSGSDNSSSIYNYQRLEVNGITEDGNRSTNQTSWPTGEYGSDSNISSNMEISLFKPFEAVHTTMRSQSTSLANGVDSLRIDYFDSVHKANTSFTGFTLLATAGNATGSVSVFGYAKA